jgi:hypothetical protein
MLADLVVKGARLYGTRTMAIGLLEPYLGLSISHSPAFLDLPKERAFRSTKCFSRVP